MPTETLHQLVLTAQQQLADLEVAFSLSPDSLRAWEYGPGISVSTSCTGDAFAERFTLNRVSCWFDCFEADLSLEITIVDTGQSYSVSFLDRSGLDAVLDEVGRYDIDRISVKGELKKEHLAAVISGMIDSPIDALFFSPKALESRVTLRGVESLRETGIFSADHHTVIAILSASGVLQSEYVTVIGLADASPLEPLPLSSPYSRSRIQTWARIRSLRDASANWLGLLGQIDPHTLFVESVRPGLETLCEKMVGIAKVMSMLQFCVSVTEPDSNTIEARIAQSAAATLFVAKDADYRTGNQQADGLVPGPKRLLRWVFGGESDDKLDIIRDLMEREVRGYQGDVIQHLLTSVPSLLDSARATYKTLRLRAFEAYLRSREEARTKVAGFVAASRAIIDKLRTDMLNRALQFFAAIIAYLAISVFQPGLPTRYKILGVFLGLVYIGLIGFFQLLPAWFQYGSERREAEEAVNSFAILTPSEREKIIAQLPSGFWTTFTRWFVACTTIYGIGMLALIGMLIYLAFAR